MADEILKICRKCGEPFTVRCLPCGRLYEAAHRDKHVANAAWQARKLAAKAYSLTAERLRALLHYDPDSGEFTRRINMAHEVAGAIAGRIAGARGYRSICIDYRTYSVHRLAWLYVHGQWPVGQIDHINRDKLDNRICNLRCVSATLNLQNIDKARSHNQSGYLGATRVTKNGKWFARITVNGEKIYGGVFETAEAASAEYFRMKRKFHEGYASGVL